MQALEDENSKLEEKKEELATAHAKLEKELREFESQMNDI